MLAALSVDGGLRSDTFCRSIGRPQVEVSQLHCVRVRARGDILHPPNTTQSTPDSAHPPPRGLRAATGAMVPGCRCVRPYARPYGHTRIRGTWRNISAAPLFSTPPACVGNVPSAKSPETILGRTFSR